MKQNITFIYPLSDDLVNRLRVRAVKERGSITNFVVQYEALIDGKWCEIVRYDTSHGFAHKDIIHPNGRQDKQALYLPSFNLAFTFAINDLKASWQWYRLGYEMEMKNEKG